MDPRAVELIKVGYVPTVGPGGVKNLPVKRRFCRAEMLQIILADLCHGRCVVPDSKIRELAKARGIAPKDVALSPGEIIRHGLMDPRTEKWGISYAELLLSDEKTAWMVD